MTTAITAHKPNCPSCGYRLSLPTYLPSTDPPEAQLRIRDLEAQVKLLNSKAAAAVDKLADYEDEIRFLQNQGHRNGNGGFISPPPEDQVRPQTAPSQQPQTAQSRIASISNLWTGRKSSPNIHRTNASDPSIPPVPPTPGHLTSQLPHPSPGFFSNFTNSSSPNLPLFTSQPQPDPNLTAALEAERQARARAEQTLSQTQSELEDLTAKLFGEANEMVAQERRARAKLEERVRLLEKRDGEKRRRLERLEGAMQRIERVRGLVG